VARSFSLPCGVLGGKNSKLKSGAGAALIACLRRRA
jgi:hypothetical protein